MKAPDELFAPPEPRKNRREEPKEPRPPRPRGRPRIYHEETHRVTIEAKRATLRTIAERFPGVPLGMVLDLLIERMPE